MSHAETLASDPGGLLHGTGPDRTGEPSSAGVSSGPSGVGGLGEAKAALRARILARRRAMPEEERAAAGRQLRDAVLAMPDLQMAGSVAAYVAVGTEPATRGLIFA